MTTKPTTPTKPKKPPPKKVFSHQRGGFANVLLASEHAEFRELAEGEWGYLSADLKKNLRHVIEIVEEYEAHLSPGEVLEVHPTGNREGSDGGVDFYVVRTETDEEYAARLAHYAEVDRQRRQQKRQVIDEQIALAEREIVAANRRLEKLKEQKGRST